MKVTADTCGKFTVEVWAVDQTSFPNSVLGHVAYDSLVSLLGKKGIQMSNWTGVNKNGAMGQGGFRQEK